MQQRLDETDSEYEARKKRVSAVMRGSNFSLARVGGGATLSPSGPTSIVSSTDPFGDGSLIAKYQMENNVLDTTGNHNAISTGVTYGVGKFDTAGVFADNVYADVASLTRIATGDNITVSLWFKKSKDDYDWLLTIDGRREIGFASTSFLLYAKVEAQPSIISTLTYNDGLWHNVIATFEGAGCTELLVDNVSIGTSITKATFSDTGSRIGGYPALNTTHCFSGSIDQVEIYNRVLTPTEMGYLQTQVIP